MKGRNVVGDIGRSFVYPAEDNPALNSLQQWVGRPGSRNRRILGNVGPSGDAAMDRGSWEKTRKEIDKGYCRFIPDSEFDINTMCATG
eukprot:5968070-Alexandrium_andersonii.AAC.1